MYPIERCPRCGHLTRPASGESWDSSDARSCDYCEISIEEEYSYTAASEQNTSPSESSELNTDFLKYYKPSSHVVWQNTSRSKTDGTVRACIQQGIIVSVDEELGQLTILQCCPEIGKPEVFMDFIYLSDCAATLYQVDDNVDDTQQTMQDGILQRAFHALDNQHRYFTAEDYTAYCRKDKKPLSFPECPLSFDKVSINENFADEYYGEAFASDNLSPSPYSSGRSHMECLSMDEPDPMYEFQLGDHVCWRDDIGDSMKHGIVSCVNTSELLVICVGTARAKPKVMEHVLDLCGGHVYVNEYSENIKRNNPCEAILVRARFYLGLTSFRTDKEFALFCVTGIRPSNESESPNPHDTPKSSRSRFRNSFSTSVDPKPLKQPQSMVLGNRTKVTAENYKYTLQPGDHIAWHRPYIIWHHAIVVKVYANQYAIDIIHWSKENGKVAVIQEKQDLTYCFRNGESYRISYDEKISQKNPPNKVLERATSRLGETGYKLFSENCEAFATHCKTGIDILCNQSRWLVSKVKQVFKTAVAGCLRSIPAKAIFAESIRAITPAEIIETIVKGSNWVGAGIVILVEGRYCYVDIRKYHNSRKNGEMSYITFLKETVTRVTEALVTAGFVIGGGLLGSMIPGAVLVTTLLGGAIGGLIAKPIGQMLGNQVSKAVKHVVKHDNKAVNSINDLNIGDQIFVYRTSLPDPYYYIVVDGNPEKKQLKVIHQNPEQGIVEEWIDFMPPVYRVEYEIGASRDPGDIIDRATSKLNTPNTYNALTNNSRHFADWCKQV